MDFILLDAYIDKDLYEWLFCVKVNRENDKSLITFKIFEKLNFLGYCEKPTKY